MSHCLWRNPSFRSERASFFLLHGLADAVIWASRGLTALFPPCVLCLSSVYFAAFMPHTSTPLSVVCSLIFNGYVASEIFMFCLLSCIIVAALYVFMCLSCSPEFDWYVCFWLKCPGNSYFIAKSCRKLEVDSVPCAVKMHYMIIYISVQLWCLCFNELLCVLFCAWGWDVLIDVIGSTASILIPCFTLRVLTAAHHASTISEAIERVSSSPQAQPPCSYFNVCVHRNIIHVILCQHQYLLSLIHLEHGDFCRW